MGFGILIKESECEIFKVGSLYSIEEAEYISTYFRNSEKTFDLKNIKYTLVKKDKPLLSSLIYTIGSKLSLIETLEKEIGDEEILRYKVLIPLNEYLNKVNITLKKQKGLDKKIYEYEMSHNM